MAENGSIGLNKDELEEKINFLNQLHRDFKSQLKTDLARLEKIKVLMVEIQNITSVKPLYNFPLEGNEIFLVGLQELDNLANQKGYAIKNGNFENAAELRDEEGKLRNDLYNQLRIEMSPNQKPFLKYQGIVYYYEVDSRVVELLAEGYKPILDDGVGKNIAPLQKKGMLAYDVLNAGQLKKYLNADW